MVSFKFSFGVVGKSKEKGIVNKYVIIVAKCEGIIRYIDGTYKVEYNGKLYSITGESYRTKGVKKQPFNNIGLIGFYKLSENFSLRCGSGN